ncbi:hypothetical protein TREMEDRAFT_61807 [Tremella mesenterica DSM 1558]|uniref:uncharacterized protein n=1 Tax=Tremella mesenterica (strain ATCC 24925 / CBS 8224 / DSM 1558 / NBRC 9311 / NRRL Y-6157 / RJB 2259-6 / UBC 559-6) TaxID=578456 RepID=UPI0003F4A40A|nr:uncharacterized protein TREMEDRAFT_61807 [Tremella mesenterica DSM 1558]EIW70045.1 hypothetical protein TREMEDRAFT_61807 [Tremella mesenterica DSM 1558]
MRSTSTPDMTSHFTDPEYVFHNILDKATISYLSRASLLDRFKNSNKLKEFQLLIRETLHSCCSTFLSSPVTESDENSLISYKSHMNDTEFIKLMELNKPMDPMSIRIDNMDKPFRDEQDNIEFSLRTTMTLRTFKSHMPDYTIEPITFYFSITFPDLINDYHTATQEALSNFTNKLRKDHPAEESLEIIRDTVDQDLGGKAGEDMFRDQNGLDDYTLLDLKAEITHDWKEVDGYWWLALTLKHDGFVSDDGIKWRALKSPKRDKTRDKGIVTWISWPGSLDGSPGYSDVYDSEEN